MATDMATGKRQNKARREYGSGSVHQRKSDGLWVGTVEAGLTASGKRRRITVSGPTEKIARDRLKVRRAEVEGGVISTVSIRTTFKVWSDEWLASAEHRLRPKTYVADRSAIRQWMMPVFGHKRLSQLTPGDVEAMQQAMIDKGKSSSTIRRAQSVLNKMLKAAIIRGHRIHPGITMMEKPPTAENDRTAMPHPHAIAALRVIETEPDPSRWVAMILNGIRQAERLGLTWDCVDFDNNVIYIRQQLQPLQYKDNKNKHLGFRVPVNYNTVQIRGSLHLVPVKTKSGQRLVPMTKWMRAALLQWREVAPHSPYDLVWPDKDGGPIDPKHDRREWERIQDKALILHPRGRHYTVHEGRHSTITLLKGLGFKDEVIAQIVGQSRLVYDYVHVDMLAEAAAALESLATKLELD